MPHPWDHIIAFPRVITYITRVSTNYLPFDCLMYLPHPNYALNAKQSCNTKHAISRRTSRSHRIFEIVTTYKGNLGLCSLNEENLRHDSLTCRITQAIWSELLSIVIKKTPGTLKKCVLAHERRCLLFLLWGCIWLPFALYVFNTTAHDERECKLSLIKHK